MMKWGRNIRNVTEAGAAAAAGFQWVQLPLSLIAGLSPRELEEAGRTLKDVGADFEVCLVDLPPEVRITQKGFNLYAWLEYMKKGIRGAAELGCRTLAWCDGRARLLPVEGDTVRAKEQVMQFLFLAAEFGEKFGTRILVEPSDPRSSNFLNSLEEADAFFRRIGKENLGAVFNFGELYYPGREALDLLPFLDRVELVRLEFPDPETCADRGLPAGPIPLMNRFLEVLRTVSYRGRLLPSDSLPPEEIAGLRQSR